MVSDSTVGAAISEPSSRRTKTQIRADKRRRQKAAARGPEYVAPEVARTEDAGPPRCRNRNVAKRLRNNALKAACKAAEQAINLAGDAAEPSQKPAFHWQGGRKGTKLEPTLPANKRLAAAQAVLSSLQAAEPLQVDVSRDGPSGTGTKHARDAGGCSTGQTHTHTHKSRRMSRVGSDGKQLTQNWPEDEENGVEFRYLCGNVDHSGALEEAGVCEADAIIIGPAEDLPDNEADASLLSSIIMVQDLLIESQRPRSHPVHVVGVVRCPQTVKVANYMVKDLSQGTMTAELLQPDELVSGLMAQVTSEPVLAPLLSELIHSTEGQEVRLREPADYHIHDLEKTTFAEVAEYARTKTETAIGYVSMQGELFLAPEAGHKHIYRNTDHVVVFAKE